MAVLAFEIERSVRPNELLALMREHKWLQCEQWGISVDEHGAWLTNPYGVDCMLFQDMSEAGAQKILDYMDAGDKNPHEWAHL